MSMSNFYYYEMLEESIHDALKDLNRDVPPAMYCKSVYAALLPIMQSIKTDADSIDLI